MGRRRRKKILVLSVSAGAGHVRAAQALCAAAAVSSDLEAEHVDVMDLVPAAFRKVYAESYIQLIDRAPLLWAHLYARTDRRAGDSKLDGVRRMLERLNTRRLAATLEAAQPDAIVCTHFLPAELLGRRIRKNRPTAPVFVAVTDFDVHGLWVHERMQGYCVATPEVAARLAARGIAAAQVHVTGIPVAPAFREPQDRAAIRRSLGLASDRPVALMMSGGAGVGDLRSLVVRLVASDLDCQLLVLAGRNAALLAQLQEIAATHPGKVFPLGFTSTVEQLMAAADVAITKPGGLTSSECLAVGLPMIVVSPIPGQEERNADYLLEAGAAVKAVDAAALEFKLRQLLDDPARLPAMRAAALRAGRADAADRVLDIVRAAPGVAGVRE